MTALKIIEEQGREAWEEHKKEIPPVMLAGMQEHWNDREILTVKEWERRNTKT